MKCAILFHPALYASLAVLCCTARTHRVLSIILFVTTLLNRSQAVREREREMIRMESRERVRSKWEIG